MDSRSRTPVPSTTLLDNKIGIGSVPRNTQKCAKGVKARCLENRFLKIVGKLKRVVKWSKNITLKTLKTLKVYSKIFNVREVSEANTRSEAECMRTEFCNNNL